MTDENLIAGLHPLNIEIARLRRIEAAAREFFASEEAVTLTNLDTLERAEATTRRYVAREALRKAIGGE